MLLTLKRPTPKRLRIIDALIAEHLFEWKWFSAVGTAYLVPPWGQERAREFSVHWTEGLIEQVVTDRTKAFITKPRTAVKSYEIQNHYSDSYANWTLPKYTTNKGDNWEVIEEITKRFTTLSLLYCPPYKPCWQVQTAAADDLMLAVCLYALDRLKIELPWKPKPKRREAGASLKRCAISN